MPDENLFFSLTQKYTKQLLLQVFIRKKTKHGSKYLYLKAINKIAEKKKKLLILSGEGIIAVAVEMVKYQSGKAERENLLMKSGKEGYKYISLNIWFTLKIHNHVLYLDFNCGKDITVINSFYPLIRNW